MSLSVAVRPKAALTSTVAPAIVLLDRLLLEDGSQFLLEDNGAFLQETGGHTTAATPFVPPIVARPVLVVTVDDSPIFRPDEGALELADHTNLELASGELLELADP